MKLWTFRLWVAGIVCSLRGHRWVYRHKVRRRCLRCGTREKRIDHYSHCWHKDLDAY